MFAKLYAIADVKVLEEDERYVHSLLEAGVRLIQLRAKSLPAPVLSEFARRVIEMRNQLAPTARIIINDSIEIAAEVGADGVHLGQDDRPPAEARKLLGPEALIGLSTHNAEQVRRAPAALVDYIAFGPVFASPTKSGHAPVTGLAALEAACALSPRPIVAIGGITATNAPEVFAAGAASIAVISELRAARDVHERVHLLGGL